MGFASVFTGSGRVVVRALTHCPHGQGLNGNADVGPLPSLIHLLSAVFPHWGRQFTPTWPPELKTAYT